jgi:hypothetical protein
MTGSRELRRSGLVLIVCAFAAYTAANLLHNRWGVDLALAPAALFVGLVLWRRRRVFLLPAAVLIFLPAFAFFRVSELRAPADPFSFYNHVALLIAGVLGVLSAMVALAPTRRAGQP